MPSLGQGYEPIIRMATVAMADDAGFEVLEAGNADEAVPGHSTALATMEKPPLRRDPITVESV